MRSGDWITINGQDYQLDAVLSSGVGSYGQVLAATDAAGQPVAIKVINTEAMMQADPALHGHWRAHLEREIAFLSSLDASQSRHVVALLNHGVIGDQPALVLERLQANLGQWLMQRQREHDPPPDLLQILDWASQILDGLDVVHQAGFIYRDLKFSNLLVGEDGARLKLADFGSLKREDGDNTRSFIGTPATMAPEQALPVRRSVEGGHEYAEYAVDYRADYYALGLLLFVLLTGRATTTAQRRLGQLLAMHGQDGAARQGAQLGGLDEEERLLLRQAIEFWTVPVHPEHGGAAEELAALIERLLARDPAHRPENSAEIHAVLDTAGSRQVPVLPELEPAPESMLTIRPGAPPKRRLRHAGRRPAAPFSSPGRRVALAVGLGLAGMMAWALLSPPNPPSPPDPSTTTPPVVRAQPAVPPAVPDAAPTVQAPEPPPVAASRPTDETAKATAAESTESTDAASATAPAPESVANVPEPPPEADAGDESTDATAATDTSPVTESVPEAPDTAAIPPVVPTDRAASVQTPAVQPTDAGADAARRQAQAEAKAKAETEARRQAQAEAKARAEAEARRQAEAKAKAKAETEARRQAQAEAKARAEIEARRQAQAEAEARRQAQAEARRQAQAEAEARRQAQIEAKTQAEVRRQAQAKARAETEARRQARAAEAAKRRESPPKTAVALPPIKLESRSRPDAPVALPPIKLESRSQPAAAESALPPVELISRPSSGARPPAARANRNRASVTARTALQPRPTARRARPADPVTRLRDDAGRAAAALGDIVNRTAANVGTEVRQGLQTAGRAVNQWTGGCNRPDGCRSGRAPVERRDRWTPPPPSRTLSQRLSSSDYEAGFVRPPPGRSPTD